MSTFIHVIQIIDNRGPTAYCDTDLSDTFYYAAAILVTHSMGFTQNWMVIDTWKNPGQAVISATRPLFERHLHILRPTSSLQGSPSGQIAGLGWLLFCLFHLQPGSAWADGKLAEVAEQLGQMVEHYRSKSTQPTIRPDGPPCMQKGQLSNDQLKYGGN